MIKDMSQQEEIAVEKIFKKAHRNQSTDQSNRNK